jgi:hypothetical protein
MSERRKPFTVLPGGNRPRKRHEPSPRELRERRQRTVEDARTATGRVHKTFAQVERVETALREIHMGIEHPDPRGVWGEQVALLWHGLATLNELRAVLARFNALAEDAADAARRDLEGDPR